MTKPLQVNERELIENTDGLVACNKDDREHLASCDTYFTTGNGETILELDGERWVMCWVRMPEVTS